MMKKIFLSGIGVYLVLFIYAVLFYKERTLFCDAAYYLYNIVKDDTFFIQHQRFGGVFGQFLAVIAGRLGMSVSVIAMGYSLSFIAFHCVIYLITGFVLKDYRWSLMILLGLTLYLSDLFFAPQTELALGFTFFCLYMALLQKSRDPGYQALIVVGCIPFIVFFHPLMLFITAYAICFFCLCSDIFTKRQLRLTGISFIIVLAIKLIFFRDKYEGETTGLGYFIKLFPDYYTPALHKFLVNCLSKYCWLTIIFVITIWHYYRHKAWEKLILITAVALGYVMLVHISHPLDEGLDFYMENLYVPFVIFIGLPFVFDVMPALRIHQGVLIGAILLTGLVRIYITHDRYTDRLNWQREYLAQHGHQKLLVKSAMVPRDTLMLTWASPYEFCLLSTIESGYTASINFHDDPAIFNGLLNDPKIFIHAWAGTPYSDLPADRFKFRDTIAPYQLSE
jgi:hypothetical protein